jgi:hypothetical protein
MNSCDCITNKSLFITLLIGVVLWVYHVKYRKPKIKYVIRPCPPCPECPKCPECNKMVANKNNNKNDKQTKLPASTQSSITPNVNPLAPQQQPTHHQHVNDMVKIYDYRKIGDPLTEPTRRLPRHVIPTDYMQQYFDKHTRGQPDTYTLMGILLKEDNGYIDNRILKLFGRQTYPGSNRYEYYTFVEGGVGEIKLMLQNKNNKELMGDDTIDIPEVSATYSVQLHKIDEPRYYPNV